MTTSPQRLRLTELESQIEKGFNAFVEVSRALIEIRDKRLFLEAGFSSFEKYCWGKYGKTYNWAWKMIQAGEAQNSVDEALPSVSAARALAKTPPPKRKAVLEVIKDSGKPITAKSIQSASKPKSEAKKQTPKERTEPIVEDGTGLEVPKEALAIWNRRGEVQDLLSQLSGIKSALARYFESGDALFAEVDFNEALADTSRLYTNLKLAMPFAVCPYCNGVMSDPNCNCKGRRVLSQFYYEHMVPTELKNLRES